MKREVKIVLDPNTPPNKKGDFFEDIVREILESQRYQISQRVNFTGMEIDLIAKHLDRNETAYIECKAKEKLASSEIKVFVFNVEEKNAIHGFFISTKEYEHQVAGLIDNIKKKHDHLYFWGPDKIIELLQSSGIIKKQSKPKSQNIISKQIFSYTYFGKFYIYIILENTMPTRFVVYDASTSTQVADKGIIDHLSAYVDDIKDLEILISGEPTTSTNGQKHTSDTIVEIHESENWYDYLPASSKHFIGRSDLKSNIIEYFSNVLDKNTQKRIFYIDGKSGWGKSSLLSEIRGKTRNKYYKNKYYAKVYDARSASTGNFISLSFKKFIDSAFSDGFLKRDLFSHEIEIISNFDIIGSDSAKKLLRSLEEQNKLLIIVFDQFEDIFRKSEIFKSFHKFLLDINSASSNIIVGFSWKSEINIPVDNEAYYLWQQAKEYALQISMREFNNSEINGVINQLSKTINKPIDLSLKRRLVESSQGFPWLTKKLCIHVLKQIKSGKTIESLIEQKLNCEVLFKDDTEGLATDELKALKYIAKRAYDGEFFDGLEIDEMIQEKVITGLINKRLIIKSGSKYNIYWDIFRDYLVTDKIPLIGENYILRQDASVCFDVFMLFKEQSSLTVKQCMKLHPRTPGEGAMLNALRELQSIGVVNKSGIKFVISSNFKSVSKSEYKNYLKRKFKEYRPILELNRIQKRNLDYSDITDILKSLFKGVNFKDDTWFTYSKYLMNWIILSGISVSKKFEKLKAQHRTRGYNDFTPQRRPKQDVEMLEHIIKTGMSKKDVKSHHSLYDLKAFELISLVKRVPKLTNLGESLKDKIGKPDFYEIISDQALKSDKIQYAYSLYQKDNRRKIFNEECESILNSISSKEYRRFTKNILYAWANFIFKSKNYLM